MSQIKQVIIAELALDAATKYVSGERVRRTTPSPPSTLIYSGTVRRWGTIEKSIPCPSGMPQISNARILISDHYREWRDALYNQPARRRIMSIYVLPEGGSVAATDPVYVGEVVDVIFLPAAIEIEIRDRTFAWLDEEIPAMAVPQLYPDIKAADEGGFVPVVFGECVSPEESPPTAEGLIPLPHIGIVDSPDSPTAQVDRWAVAATPVLSFTLYRREQTSVDEEVDAPEWVEVDPSEYTEYIYTIAAEDNPYGNFEMNHTVVDFDEQQPDGTEIRADIRGIYERGAWGDLFAEDGSLESPPVPLRNPIDAFINMTFFLTEKAGVSVDVFDTEEIGDLRETFEDLALYCDGAITEAMTGREWLGQFLSSFELDMIQNRRGLLSLRFTRDLSAESPPVTIPVFKEGKHILRESFTERLPEHVMTQIQGRFQYDNARARFADWLLIDTAEQDVLNLPDEDSPTSEIEKIEKAVVDLHFVRDEDTATEVLARRLAFQSLGSFRQEFQIPLPVALDAEVELGDLIAITHSMGLAENGYVEQQAKVLRISHDLDALITTLGTILWPPQQIGAAEEGAGEGRPTTAEEWEDPAFVNPIRSRIIDGALAIDDDAALGDSATYAECQIDSTRPTTPNYAQLFLYGFPEPAPPEGQSLQTAELFVVAEYVLDDDSGGQPQSLIEVFNAYHHDYTGSTYLSTGKAGLFDNGGAVEPGIATAEYSHVWTAEEFETDFPNGAADIYVRAIQWHSLFQDFPSTIKLRIYDCWIEYTYA